MSEGKSMKNGIRMEIADIIEVGIKAHFAAGFDVGYTSKEITDAILVKIVEALPEKKYFHSDGCAFYAYKDYSTPYMKNKAEKSCTCGMIERNDALADVRRMLGEKD